VSFGSTDSDGRGELVAPPGEYELHVDQDVIVQPFSVRAETTEVTVELPGTGTRVSGRVLMDDARPVAGASVRIGPAEVARSDAMGEYRVRFHRGLGHLATIWARSPGAVPSLAHVIQGPSDLELAIDLVLRGEGASLDGRVVAANGAGVPEAQVTLGAPPKGWIDPPHTEPPPETWTTDASGRFRASPLLPGTCPVRIHSDLGILETTVSLRAGETTIQDFALPGTRFVGTVRDEDGRPVAGAQLRLSRKRHPAVPPEEFGVSLADAEGRFDQFGIATGPLHVEAVHPGHIRSEVAADFDVQPGSTIAWDPVLPALGVIAGRVVDPRGEPLPGLGVGLRMPGGWGIRRETDAEGRFEYDGAPRGTAVPIDVREHDSVVATVESALADGEEIVIVVPDDRRPLSTIVGRIVDPQGSALGGVEILAIHDEQRGASRAYSDEAIGAFEIGPVRSGSYRLSLRAEGRAPLRLEAELPFAEVVDLGEIIYPDPAALRLTVRDPEGLVPLGVTGWIEQVPESNVGNLVAEGEHFVASHPLPPGELVLHVRARRMWGVRVPVTLRGGMTLERTVIVPHTRQRTVVVAGGESANASIRVPLPTGEEIDNSPLAFDRESRSWRGAVWLPVGSPRIEVATALSYWSVTVTVSDEESDEPIVLFAG
jgi:hypothetical protein